MSEINTTESRAPRTLLILNGLKVTDTVISKLVIASDFQSLSDNPVDSIKVLLRAEDDVLQLASRIDRIAHIAIEFQNFTDGRGYSQATLLRKRLKYQGRLRAVGDVLVDQVHYLARVGFDEIELREDQSADVALRALKAFTAPYQSAQDHAAPVWVRHAAHAEFHPTAHAGVAA